MKIQLVVKENFNADLGKTVYTICRDDGQLLMPADGIQGLNYSEYDQAAMNLPAVERHVNNGGGQF